jgi:hypothetical protein
MGTTGRSSAVELFADALGFLCGFLLNDVISNPLHGAFLLRAAARLLPSFDFGLVFCRWCSAHSD